MIYYIYTLIDPCTSEVCYVGITGNPELRLRQHLSNSEGHANQARKKWIQGLLEIGVQPYMRVLEDTNDEAKAREREYHWVQYYFSQQAPLLNIQLKPYEKVEPSTKKEILFQTPPKQVWAESRTDLLMKRMDKKYGSASLNENLKIPEYLQESWGTCQAIDEDASGYAPSLHVFLATIHLYENEDLTKGSKEVLNDWYLKQCQLMNIEPLEDILRGLAA